VGSGVASAPRIGVIAAADIVKPLRADVRELSPQKSSSWFYEAPSISAVDLNLAGAIGSEPLMRFQGNAQADWSIASAYTDNSASEHKEQLSVLLDSAQFAGVAMSVGVVWWASRLTGVVGSLLASVPAWRHLDPLPVVGQDEALDEADWNEDPNDLDADADELAISMVLDGAPSAVAMSG